MTQRAAKLAAFSLMLGNVYACEDSALESLEQRLFCAARSTLEKAFPAQKAQWRLRAGAMPSVELTSEQIRSVSAALPAHVALKPNMQMRITLRAANWQKVYWLNIDVDIPASALVYQRDHAAKTPIDRIQLEQAVVNLAGVGGEADVLLAQSSVEATKKLRLKRRVRQGSIATTRDFEAQPDIDRNEEINMIVRADGVVISAKGRALREASIGQVVDVRVGTSTLKALVTGEKEGRLYE